MAVQIQIRRDTAANWSTNNPILAQGELGFETDTRMAKLGNGSDVWNDLDYWPQTSGSEQRIYYDTLTQGYNAYPATYNSISIPNVSCAPRIINFWDTQFGNCFWEVENFDTHIKSIHTFPTLNDFVDWKNNNIPHNIDGFTQRIAVRPFDIVDNGIPIVERIYGYPNVYAGFKRKYIKSGEQHFGEGSHGNATLRAVWEHFFPFTVGLISDVDFNTGAGGRKACWTSKNYSRLYSMPKIGEIISVDSSPSWVNGRYSANENWEGFNPLDPASFRLFIDEYVIVLVDESGNLQELVEYASGRGGRKIRNHLLSGSNNNAALVAFKLVSSDPVGNRQIAVLFKPMGIDRLWLPYFDDTIYDMEVVWLNDYDMQPSYFNKFSSGDFNVGSGSSPHPNSGCFLKKSYWIPNIQRLNYGLQHSKYQNKWKAYFRFRNKLTRKVGPLSPSCVELKIDETNAPVKLIVSRRA